MANSAFEINSSGTVNPGTAGQLAYYNSSGTAVDGGQLDNVLGTATNDNAPAGYVGEFVSSVILNASAISFSDGISANLTSISLTAGDWEVWGNIQFVGSGANLTQGQAGISTTSATSADLAYTCLIGGSFADTNIGVVAPTQRISINSTTTVYMVGVVNFGSGSANGRGGIYARRVR